MRKRKTCFALVACGLLIPTASSSCDKYTRRQKPIDQPPEKTDPETSKPSIPTKTSKNALDFVFDGSDDQGFQEISIKEFLNEEYLVLSTGMKVRLAGIRFRSPAANGTAEVKAILLSVIQSVSTNARVKLLNPKGIDAVVYYQQPLAFRDLAPAAARTLGKPQFVWLSVNELFILLGLATAEPDSVQLGPQFCLSLWEADQIYSGAVYEGIRYRSPEAIKANPALIAYYRAGETFAQNAQVIEGHRSEKRRSEWMRRVEYDIARIEELR